MKTLVSLALVFFLSTFGFVVAHNIVHHEDEPVAMLPGSVSPPPPATSPTATSSTTPTFSSTPTVSGTPTVSSTATTSMPMRTTFVEPVPPSAGFPSTTTTTASAPTTSNPTANAPTSTTALTTTAPTTVAGELPHTARLELTEGTTSNSNVADGRSTFGKLVVTNGTGTAETDAKTRQIKISARSNGSDGRSIWFALLGSNITLTKGAVPRANVNIRIDGVRWDGTLTSDGGTAAAEIRFQVQDEAGVELANVAVDQAAQPSAGRRAFSSAGSSVNVAVPVTVESKPVVLHAFLYVKADAQGGSGATSVDLRSGVSFTSIAVAIGAPAPPTTTPPAPRAPGSGISAQQLAEHSTAESCWLLIQGRVYDMTPYLRRHPGSQLPVLKVCGKEATDAFLTQGGRGSRHSYEAINKMEALYIGDYTG